MKGNEIVSRPRTNVAPDTLRHKIDRYVKRWQRQSGGAWPLFHRFEGIDVQAAGTWEHLKDRLQYALLRAYDAFTQACFCAAPLRQLQAYRNRKYRKPTEPVEVIPQTAPARVKEV